MKTNRDPSPFLNRVVRSIVNGGALASCLIFGTPASAAIMFAYDYSENTPGVGFLDATDGAARQAALTTAGNLFSNFFGGYFTQMGTITMRVTSTDDISSQTLASAFSNFVNVPGTFGGGEVIQRKLINGTDLNGAALDGGVDVNWGYGWELDPNANPGAKYDFYAALFHEFTHSLGFGSEAQGTPGHDRFNQGGEGSGSPGSWAKWDQFLTECTFGRAVIDGTSYEIDDINFAGAKTDGGCFVGANAVSANGGPVKLFANPDQSHLDNITFPVALMRPDRGVGLETRDYNAVEVGILTDLGYTRQPDNGVPEPTSVALLLAGLAGFVAYRRKA